MNLNKINFNVSCYNRFPRIVLETDTDNSTSVDVYFGPDELFGCLKDLIADWDCLKPSKKQILSDIVDEIIIRLMEDRDV